jgi:hypothetical protein
MGRDTSRLGGGGENCGTRALGIPNAAGSLRRSFRGGFTGLRRGGEAPGGRDEGEENRECVKGKSLAGSGLLLGSSGGVG